MFLLISLFVKMFLRMLLGKYTDCESHYVMAVHTRAIFRKSRSDPDS